MKKILIVDDDPIFAKTLSDMLDAEKYTVVTASNGEEGLEQFDTEAPDLVLLDMLMPKLSGIGFLKELRSRSEDVTTPVLITSNLSGIDEISGGVALGVRGYIIKSEENLESIVKSVAQVLGDA